MRKRCRQQRGDKIKWGKQNRSEGVLCEENDITLLFAYSFDTDLYPQVFHGGEWCFAMEDGSYLPVENIRDCLKNQPNSDESGDSEEESN